MSWFTDNVNKLTGGVTDSLINRTDSTLAGVDKTVNEVGKLTEEVNKHLPVIKIGVTVGGIVLLAYLVTGIGRNIIGTD